MLTLDVIRHKLINHNLKAVAADSKLHYNAVYRLMNGQTNPSYETVKKLSDYLEASK
jgi:DNA-binding phage protein